MSLKKIDFGISRIFPRPRNCVHHGTRVENSKPWLRIPSHGDVTDPWTPEHLAIVMVAPHGPKEQHGDEGKQSKPWPEMFTAKKTTIFLGQTYPVMKSEGRKYRDPKYGQGMPRPILAKASD